MRWQPIDTVPPDTPVLVFQRVPERDIYVVTVWQTELYPHWRGYSWLEPSHWMPLPPPPAADAAAPRQADLSGVGRLS